jgi:hypothetical protein
MKNYIYRVLKVQFILSTITFLLMGCANYSEKETKLALIQKIEPKPAVFGTNESKDMKTIKKVREEVLSMQPVYDVAIVKGKKDTVVAYKVKHLHRFKMKQIEADLNKRLEKKFPKEDFVISSDYKIFLEVIELIHDEEDPNFSDKDADKKLHEIIRLKQELT